ncbi:MAG: gliding motility-associated C-terminal domain-containing protein [Saprospiraceae bacterium]|nr:gliding motility-associated C-terminal domain-containing protein [Saprospiraceae bacterium]
MTFSKVKRHMPIKVIIFVFFLLATGFGNAQSTFHRTYPSSDNKDLISIASTQLRSDNYVALEFELDSTANKVAYSDTLILTAFKPKGDILWSKKIYVHESLNGFAFGKGSVIEGDNDSIYFSVVINATDKANKIIGAASSAGALGWIRSYSTNNNVGDGNKESHLLANLSNSIFSAHAGGRPDSNGIVLARRTYNGSTLWSKLYHAGQEKNEKVTDLNILKDSTIAISGILDSGIYFNVLDTFGTVRWSRTFQNDKDDTEYSNVRSAELGDSSIVFVVNNIKDHTSEILKISKNGIVAWAKRLILNGLDSSVFTDIAADNNGNIIVGGLAFIDIDSSYKMVIKLSPDGNVIWKSRFPKVKANHNDFGSVFATNDGGSAFINSVIDDGKLRPSFLKLDGEGTIIYDSITCHIGIPEVIFEPVIYTSDTLVWISTDGGSDSTVTFDSSGHSYEVPKLELEVRPFCPDEPIDWTFSAHTGWAVDYKWSTGENRGIDTLRVFEEGEYSVTVTVGDGVCFMLCDTVMLTRYHEPQAQIELSLGNFCANDKLTLRAGYVPGHPQVKTITWSNGVSGVNQIEITSPGTYSVTIVDMCDEAATATIATGEFPKKITSATITGNVAVDCFEGRITGILSSSGNSNGLGVERYLWNTGATTKDISIADVGTRTYTVTVIDGCGGTAVATYSKALVGQGNREVQIVVNKDQLCLNESISLNAVTNQAGQFIYLWSTGAGTAKIDVNAVGTYLVTVTDLCLNTATASVDIKEDDLTTDDISYAHVFFPDGINATFELETTLDTLTKEAHILNRTFGPINKPEYCLSAITDYEFYIFNRWGQKVFESKNINDEWDANDGEQKWPSDTYVWVVKYNIFGFPKTLKGDVTIIR